MSALIFGKMAKYVYILGVTLRPHSMSNKCVKDIVAVGALKLNLAVVSKCGILHFATKISRSYSAQ